MVLSHVLIIIVIVYGSLLNLLAKPWSSTDSLLERRRNDLMAVVLWFVLTIVATVTVREGIINKDGKHAFDLQDWTALVLPFALAAPYLLELCATLIRQLEMWRWMRRACIQTLPVAWMYRTITVGDPDPDAEWLCNRAWAPWSQKGMAARSFWQSTTRFATLHQLLRRWLSVLFSALRHSVHELGSAIGSREIGRILQNGIIVILIGALVVCTSVAFSLSIFEWMLMLVFDYLWWRRCLERHIIIARYDTVHFGRAEMQIVLDLSIAVRAVLRPAVGIDKDSVHDCIMGAVMTTAAVLENAFRRAYLCTPVYAVPISNRKVLRSRYADVGCDLDRLIKQVRVLLEAKHTVGLISIASSGGTIEASLHDNIECILSICLFFEPAQLYAVSCRIAQHERAIEKRLARSLGESTTRERVVYIDARNAILWLLWTVVTRDWVEGNTVWCNGLCDKGTLLPENVEGYDEENCTQYNEHWIDALYVTATFLSRCRYCKRFGIGVESEKGLFTEVRQLTDNELKRDYATRVFHEVSDALRNARNMSLIEWLVSEYGLEISASMARAVSQQQEWNIKWIDDTGRKKQSTCSILLDQITGVM